MVNQRIKKMKGIVYCGVVVLITIFVFGSAEATKKGLNEKDRKGIMAELIDPRKSDLFDKTFDINANHEEELITAQGETEDREEKEKIKKHLQMRSPGNYDLIYIITTFN